MHGKSKQPRNSQICDGDPLRNCLLEEAAGPCWNGELCEAAEHLWAWKLFVKHVTESQGFQLAQDLDGNNLERLAEQDFLFNAVQYRSW